MVKLGRELITLILLGLIPFISPQDSSDQSESTPSDAEDTVPPPVAQALTFSMPLVNYYNLQYSGQLQIGLNQSLFLAFDTGSLWTMVDHSDFQMDSLPNCTTAACNIPGYGHAQKETFHYITLSETIGGYVVSDSIVLDNQTSKINQTVLFSTTLSPKWYNYSNGVCGLSLQNGNQPTMLDNLYNSKIIGQRIFGLYLSNNPEAYGETTSEIVFGGSNPSYYTGNFTNVSVIAGSAYWQTNLDHIILTSASQTATVKTKAVSAIIVSGLKSILLPNNDFSVLVDTLSSNYQLNCFSDSAQALSCNCPGGDVSNFPNISFVIDAKPFIIPPTLYLDITEDVCNVLISGSLENAQGNLAIQINETASNQTNSTAASETDSSDISDSGAVGSTQPGTYIILGGAFLRNYYTIFDAENKVISFAQVVPPSAGLISALQVIYLVFGSFIVILFVAFVGCGARVIFSKRVHVAEAGSPEKPLVERKTTASQFVQGLEGN